MGRNFGARPRLGVPPPPGSPTAIHQGCQCPNEANAKLPDNTHGIVAAKCPLHGWDPFRLTNQERLQLFEVLVTLDNPGIREWLRRIKESDLLAALWDPAWGPVWARCQNNLPSGQLARLRDEWSWRSGQELEKSVQAQDRLLETLAKMMDEGIMVLLPGPHPLE